MSAAQNYRKALTTKIHVAKAQLGISDPDYRALLQTMFRAASSKALTTRQLDQLLRHFEDNCGWQPRTTKARKGDKAPSEKALRRTPMLTKIEALLAELANMQDAFVPWDYAHAILKRMYKVDRLEWATPNQLRAVIAALDKRVAKLIRQALEDKDTRLEVLRVWRESMRKAAGLRETV
ncbi:hypothetical protein JCM15519_38510 [Fundidesulfovibrio butyratiphilus]